MWNSLISEYCTSELLYRSTCSVWQRWTATGWRSWGRCSFPWRRRAGQAPLSADRHWNTCTKWRGRWRRRRRRWGPGKRRWRERTWPAFASESHSYLPTTNLIYHRLNVRKGREALILPQIMKWINRSINRMGFRKFPPPVKVLHATPL